MQLQFSQVIDLVLAVSAAFAAIISAIAAWQAFRAAKASEVSAKYQAQSFNVSILNQNIFEAYTDRLFIEATAPTIDGKEVKSLRIAKAWGTRQLHDNQQVWEQESRVESYNRKTPQNAIAYETAIALEMLGIAAFTGLIPLRLLLPEIGDVIIDDFLLSLSWIRSYQALQNTYSSVGQTLKVPMHRRHAEWLALIAGLWMSKHWKSYEGVSKLQQVYKDVENMREWVVAISNADGNLMPKNVRDDLRDLVDIPK